MASKYKTLTVVSLHNAFLDELEKEAQAFIDKTLSYVNYGHSAGYFEHQTKNLHDSYGYGIFFNGELERNGGVDAKAAVPREFSNGHVLWGREVLKTLFNGSRRTNERGYVVMIAAAMPYAINLEKGIGIQRKYRVISFMEGDAWNFGKGIAGKSLVKKVNVRDYGEPVEE